MNRFSLLTEPLLAWYDKHARSMPWRDDPTPYHVWISEIMLQQTRVSAVIPYYERFLKELPTVVHLAQCDDEKLMKLWEGLGYYSRARNLKKAALEIMEKYDGVFPSDYASLRALPGIGDYTAGAVSSIAFGKPEPAVDGNVLRVWSRITGSFSDIMADETRKTCRESLRTLMPEGKTSEYTQALMELGATVCLPNGAPLCEKCPAFCFCVAKEKGLIEQLPVKTKSKPRRMEKRTVYFLFCDGKVALRRRPKKGLLSGLWEFPNEIVGFDPSAWNFIGKEEEPFGRGKHVFSHIEWHMDSRVFLLETPMLSADFQWVDAEELKSSYAVPAAFRDFLPAVFSRLEKESEK